MAKALVLFWPKDAFRPHLLSPIAKIFGFWIDLQTFFVATIATLEHSRKSYDFLGYIGHPRSSSELKELREDVCADEIENLDHAKTVFVQVHNEIKCHEPSHDWIIHDMSGDKIQCQFIMYDAQELCMLYGSQRLCSKLVQPILAKMSGSSQCESEVSQKRDKAFSVPMQRFLSSLHSVNACLYEAIYQSRSIKIHGGRSIHFRFHNVSIFIAAIGQFAHAIEQIALLPMQSRQKHSIASHSETEKFLLLCDFCVYLLLDYYIGQRFSELIVSMIPISFLSPTLFIAWVRENVMWLMGAPAGFKLNGPLASMFGNGTMLWLDLCQYAISSIQPQSSLQYAMQSKYIGCTLKLCLLLDQIRICTWCSEIIFNYFYKVNFLQFKLSKTLWRLFLGTKWNIKRQRVDACDYSVPQLLLGTLLFTIAVFLVTTYLVFLLYFAVLRLQIRMIQFSLYAIIGILRCFSITQVLYRLWRPCFYATSAHLELLYAIPKTFECSKKDDLQTHLTECVNNFQLSQKNCTKSGIYALSFSYPSIVSVWISDAREIVNDIMAKFGNYGTITKALFFPWNDSNFFIEALLNQHFLKEAKIE